MWGTLALANLVGIEKKTAQLISWANGRTDLCTKAGHFGIQTQCSLDPFGNWKDSHIQSTVICPFHFVIGEHKDNPRAVTANSARATMLVEQAINDPFRLGIALHALQDTFSHENFTGFFEDFNSCGNILVPNVGHADMLSKPDTVEQIWKDPRNGQKIDNRQRAIGCLMVTYEFLQQVQRGPPWIRFGEMIETILWLPNNLQRCSRFKKVAGFYKLRFDDLEEAFAEKHQKDFDYAARKHLAAFLDSL